MDYYDLIEWADRQPWSNGRVGLNGVSYLAIRQYNVAALHPPSLAAVCPWVTERDEWYAARTPELEKIYVPLLVCGSFSDQSLHARGSFEVFRRAGSAQKWIYTHRGGKWSTYYSADAIAAQARFFAHFLRDEDDGWQAEPAVRIAVHEDGPEPADV